MFDFFQLLDLMKGGTGVFEIPCSNRRASKTKQGALDGNQSSSLNLEGKSLERRAK